MLIQIDVYSPGRCCMCLAWTYLCCCCMMHCVYLGYFHLDDIRSITSISPAACCSRRARHSLQARRT
jgi:hypothetical protein